MSMCVCVDSLLKSISTSHYIELSIRLEIICHVTFRYVAVAVAAAAGFVVIFLSDDMEGLLTVVSAPIGNA